MKFEACDFVERGLDHDHLCMDFTNTASGHNPVRREYLNTYADLLSWAVAVKLLTDDQADELYALSERTPADAEAVLRRAIALREAIFELLESAFNVAKPSPNALTTFNAALSQYLPHLGLVTEGIAMHWAWAEGEDDLEQVLWPVVWSAANVLVSEDRPLVRVCESESCDWVFLDTSRNHSRRWCSMETCGNRAKARRHYHRKAGVTE